MSAAVFSIEYMDESAKALASLTAASEAVGAVWVAALGGAMPGSRAEDDAAEMTDGGILAVNDALCDLRRHVEAVHAHVAAAIAARSRPELGSDGLSRRAGHRSPARLLAAATGGHPGDAARLIQVGEAMAGRMTFTGERTAPRHAHVAEALRAGRLSLSAAASITELLEKVAVHVDRARLIAVEAEITEQAVTLSLTELSTMLRRAEAWLVPDRLPEKIDELRTQRSLHVREEQGGMLSLIARLDPESAAPVRAVIDAIVGGHLRAHRGANASQQWGGGVVGRTGEPLDACSSEQTPETRSMPQLRADALVDVCRHALGCDEVPQLANTTVVVRIPLDALTSGIGVATIDGIAQPIDAGTARRMAGDAEVIPCVLGGESEILDFGRTRRLFTRAQKLALVERDGGCAFCGAPPQFTEGHHILWWSSHGGRTDLGNLILLCTSCHHRIHADEWEIRIEPPPSGDVTGGTVWFIPPARIDAHRRPRLGGRQRFDYRGAA